MGIWKVSQKGLSLVPWKVKARREEICVFKLAKFYYCNNKCSFSTHGIGFCGLPWRADWGSRSIGCRNMGTEVQHILQALFFYVRIGARMDNRRQGQQNQIMSEWWQRHDDFTKQTHPYTRASQPLMQILKSFLHHDAFSSLNTCDTLWGVWKRNKKEIRQIVDKGWVCGQLIS